MYTTLFVTCGASPVSIQTEETISRLSVRLIGGLRHSQVNFHDDISLSNFTRMVIILSADLRRVGAPPVVRRLVFSRVVQFYRSWGLL